MKNQIKTLLLLVLFLSFQASFAQKKKTQTKSKPKKEKSQPSEDIIVQGEPNVYVTEEPPMIMEAPPQSIQGDGNYSRYPTEKINDQTVWFYDKYSSNSGYKYGIKKKGQVLLPMLFERNNYTNVSDNNSFPIGIGNNYGLYNIDKETWEIPMTYYSLRHIGNDIFLARTKSNDYGLLSRENKVLIPFEWGDISTINGADNYFILQDKKTSLKGIYNLISGKFVIPCDYKYIETLDNSNYYKVNNEKGYNIVTIDNKPKFKNWYTELNTVYNSKNFIVKKDDKMGIIDENENIILPLEYKSISSSAYNDGSFLAVNKEGKYGCVLITGKISLPFEYDQINYNYSNNLKTIKNNKCGLIQINSGSPYEIVTCEYDNIDIDNETFIVKKNNLFGMLDSFGKVITPCEYSSINKVLNKGNYSKNYIYIAQKNKKYILLDKSGQQITENSFSRISPVPYINTSGYYESEARFSYLTYQNNNKNGLLDMLGQEVLETKYTDILGETNNNLLVKLNGKVGIYNLLTKKETIPCIYDQIVLDKSGTYGVMGSTIFSIVDINDNSKSVKL
ncbi:WG repeat-containing protein [Flavobacterium sp. FlaQc-57]|uniref:WG repeat-containing protein n=1 Tax=Flavobacterium sp. FlaQc-57 TaxID=3374186 RepID=UPI0037565395